jgi:hypothetical protein
MTPSGGHEARPAQTIVDRAPVVVEPAGTLRIGLVTRRFDPAIDGSLVASYIDLLCEVRRGPIPGVVHLRRGDIDALAAHAGVGTDELIDELAIALGAGKHQRATVVSLFAAGAMVVGVATALALGATRGAAPISAAYAAAAPAAAEVAAVERPAAPSDGAIRATESAGPGAAGAIASPPAVPAVEAAELALFVDPPAAAHVPVVGEDGNVYYVSVGSPPVPPTGSGGGSEPVPVVGVDGSVYVVAVGEAPLPPTGSGGGSEPVPVVGVDGSVYVVAVGEAPLPPAATP